MKMIKVIMKHLLFLTLAILYSCSGNPSVKTSNPVNKSMSDGEIIDNDTTIIEAAESIKIDSTLLSLAKHIKTKDWSFIKLKSHYRFNRDTVVIIDSIPFYSYDISSILKYYHLRSYLSNIENGGEEIIELLNNSDSCYGFSIGGMNETESSMVEVFSLPSDHQAKQIELLFIKSDPPLFMKTLSFVKAIDNKLYVFHSRYMGASWYMKKYFEWFEDQIPESINS